VTWLNPYAVDGATLSSQLLRIVAFHAVGGDEGIAEKGDLKVTASGTPDGNVHVAAGGALIRNRYNGGSGQSYAAYNQGEDVAAVPATTAGGGRTDLVVARIVDPQYDAEQPAPGAEDTFSYVRTHVITGVPAGTTSAAALNLGYPAIALARITRGASTGIVTSAQITDLRKLARPRDQEFITHLPTNQAGDNLNAALDTYERFPDQALYTVAVPDWAVTAQVTGFVEGLRKTAAGTAKFRITLQETGDSSEITEVNEPAPGGASDRLTVNLGGKINIPASVRGTNATFVVQAARTGSTGPGVFAVDNYTSTQIRLLFQELPT